MFASLQSVLISYYIELPVLPVAKWQAIADQLAPVEQVTERLTFYNIMIKVLLSLRVIKQLSSNHIANNILMSCYKYTFH